MSTLTSWPPRRGRLGRRAQARRAPSRTRSVTLTLATGWTSSISLYSQTSRPRQPRAHATSVTPSASLRLTLTLQTGRSAPRRPSPILSGSSRRTRPRAGSRSLRSAAPSRIGFLTLSRTLSSTPPSRRFRSSRSSSPSPRGQTRPLRSLSTLARFCTRSSTPRGGTTAPRSSARRRRPWRPARESLSRGTHSAESLLSSSALGWGSARWRSRRPA
eukprot:Amastigsp_a175683_243.p2 type:complete len:216 gc:universal Amastigsp_a175683_243:979-332(-)